MLWHRGRACGAWLRSRKQLVPRALRENLLITRPAWSQTKTPCGGCWSTRISVSLTHFTFLKKGDGGANTCAYSNRRAGSSAPLPPPVSADAATARRKGEMSIGAALSGATRCVHRGAPMEGYRAFSRANDRASALNSGQSAGVRAPHRPPARSSPLRPCTTTRACTCVPHTRSSLSPC